MGWYVLLAWYAIVDSPLQLAQSMLQARAGLASDLEEQQRLPDCVQKQ